MASFPFLHKHVSKTLNAGYDSLSKIPVFDVHERDVAVKVVARPVDQADAEHLLGVINSDAKSGVMFCTEDHRSYAD